MNEKLLSLQKLSTSSSNNKPHEKSNLSVICNKGDGSSISLHVCTSIGG